VCLRDFDEFADGWLRLVVGFEEEPLAPLAYNLDEECIGALRLVLGIDDELVRVPSPGVVHGIPPISQPIKANIFPYLDQQPCRW
jgi:hypothetical protein